MNIKKTWISVLSVLCLILVLFPIHAWALETEDFEYTIKDNEVTITRYIGETGEDIEVIVPDMLNGYPVTVFGAGNNVFSSYSRISLDKIILPDTVIEIGKNAFYGTNIQEIKLSNNLQIIGQSAFERSVFTSIDLPNSLTDIGKSAFYNSNITECKIPSGVKRIPENAFESSKLETITLNEGLESIDKKAFANCQNLKFLQIPSTVTEIGEEAFSDCILMESVNIPYGITTIKKATFKYCKSLKEIIIPDSVTKIEGEFGYFLDYMGAFHGCESLVSLVIPNSVTEIESFAFYSCSNLVSLVIPNSITELGDVIDYCGNLESVFIPSSVVKGDLFEGENCPKMIVYVQPGSYAEKKAKTKSKLSVVADDSVDSIAASVQPPSSNNSAPTWKQNDFGWWLENPDGSYLTNTWYQSPSSGLWYYMGADGYMLTNTITPDGYQVGMDGVWIQNSNTDSQTNKTLHTSSSRTISKKSKTNKNSKKSKKNKASNTSDSYTDNEDDEILDTSDSYVNKEDNDTDVPDLHAEVTVENAVTLLSAYDPDGAYILQHNESEKRKMLSYWGDDKLAGHGINTAVHELCHGYSHNKAGFGSEAIYIGNEESIIVDYTPVFSSREMASSIPKKLRTSRYNVYVAGDEDLSSQVRGPYGLLNELTAYYWGTNTSVKLFDYYKTQSPTIDEWFDCITAATSSYFAYAEFRFFILYYLLYARDNDSEVYQDIISNDNFRLAFTTIDEKFEELVEEMFEGIEEIKEIVESSGVSVEESNNTLWFGNSGRGIFTEEYHLLMSEMEKSKYQEMLGLLKP